MKRRKISVVLVLWLSAIGMEAFAHNAEVNNLNEQPTTSLVIANTEFYYTNSDEVNGYACLADKKYHLHRELNDRINEDNKGINRLHYTEQFDLKTLVETHMVSNTLEGTDSKVDEELFRSLNLAYRFFPVDYTYSDDGPNETLFLTLTDKDELGYYNGIGYFNQVVGKIVGGEYDYEKREDGNHMNPFGGEYALAHRGCIGRRPIVRVELYSKNNPDMVYAAGYLMLEIGELIINEDDTERLKAKEKIHSLISDCINKKNVLSVSWNSFGDYVPPSQAEVEKCAEKELYNVIGTIQGYAGEYYDSMNKGNDVPLSDIEELEDRWDEIISHIQTILAYIRQTLHSLHVTCNDGGCIYVGDTFSVSNVHKVFYIIDPKTSNVDFSWVNEITIENDNRWNFLEHWRSVWNDLVWKSGASDLLTVVPDVGYHVKSFTINGSEQTSYSIYLPSYSLTEIIVEFKEDVSKVEEICDNFFTCQDVIVANTEESNADKTIQLTWDQIQVNLSGLNGGNGISPKGWNSYEIVEDKQYIYDEAAGKLVLIDGSNSYCRFGNLSKDNIRYGNGIYLDVLTWSFSTEDFKNLFHYLKAQGKGIDPLTLYTTVDVKRYFRLHSTDTSCPDLYVGFTIPAGKLRYPSGCYKHTYDAMVDRVYYLFSGSMAIVTSGGENSYSRNVVIPETVTYNGVTYSVTRIDDLAFCDCDNVWSVTIPNSMTSIGSYAFEHCRPLSSVTIPNSITSIGDGAFAYCSDLTSVTIESNTPIEIGADVFSNIGNATLYVPYGSKVAYKKTDVWKDFKTIVEPDPEDKEILIERLNAIEQRVDLFVNTLHNDLRSQLNLSIRIIKADDYYRLIDYWRDDLRYYYGWIIGSGEDIDWDHVRENIEDFEKELDDLEYDLSHDIEREIRKVTMRGNGNGKVVVGGMSGDKEMFGYDPDGFSNSSKSRTIRGVVEVFRRIARQPFEITAVPNDGYHVKSFTINGIEQSSNSVEYTLGSEDVEVVVEFERDRNVLIVDDATVVQGGTVTLPISMTNEDAITAFQFELQLPEGFSVQDVALTARRSNQTMNYSQLENGNYQFAAFSLNARAFNGNEGALVNVILKANSTVIPGNYIIKVKNIELTTTDEQACVPANCSATLTVSNIMVGDANGDGKVSITDAVAVVNKLLGKPSANFRADAADVTSDGKITITDAVAIVNIVLGKRPANARMREPQ